MRLSIATWNVNSVRLRFPLIEKFVASMRPTFCACRKRNVPTSCFRARTSPGSDMSTRPCTARRDGTALPSSPNGPLPISSRDSYCGKSDARHVAVQLDREAGISKPVTIHNFYIPAGGDEPDPAINEKFAHKLAFLDELTASSACIESVGGARSILVGDLNVAPLEHDVWSHKQLLKVVSHTPIEVEKFTAMQRAGGWIDVMRGFVPEPAKLYTWWSYRAQDWAASDRGRRLDHIWASPALANTAHELQCPPRGPRLGKAVGPCPGIGRLRSLVILRTFFVRFGVLEQRHHKIEVAERRPEAVRHQIAQRHGRAGLAFQHT
jgi:exodeoxyribonuclease III